MASTYFGAPCPLFPVTASGWEVRLLLLRHDDKAISIVDGRSSSNDGLRRMDVGGVLEFEQSSPQPDRAGRRALFEMIWMLEPASSHEHEGRR